MATGFDTTADCSMLAGQIKAAGLDFVGRYLSQNAHKAIGAAEAKALRAAGLAIVLVYEDGPTSASYFSADRGTRDGMRAMQQASLIGAPAGTILYFAVDFDASSAEVANAVTPYFQSVNAAISNPGADQPRYRVGVYGSGAVCMALIEAGLAVKGWRACSRGWRGFSDFPDAAINQSLPATRVGLSVDPDEANGDFGAIPPA